MEDSFADGFGRNGAGVDADAADLLAFDDGDGLAHFGRVQGSFLARGSRANHEQIVLHIALSYWKLILMFRNTVYIVHKGKRIDRGKVRESEL
jgi:hypothetical protein